jgi:hypothetical protein
MSDENKVADEKRRTVLKGAAATGVAATGLGVFGSASAQQGIKNLNVQVGGDGLVSISNINALNNVQVSDVAITVIGDDLDVDVDDVLSDIEVENVQVVNVEESLNENVVQVAVAVLGAAGELVAAGSDAANLDS